MVLRRILNPVRAIALLSFLILAACGAARPEPPVSDQREIAAIADGILALGPGIDPEEAAAAARIALLYPRQLAREWNVTDSPLVHNTKVNLGIRPRGLCYHWADDLEARLRQEGFETIELHRAIANHDNFRIEHSTVIISAPGDTMKDGMVLDPWRYGGLLFWSPTLDDSDYRWVERSEVFAWKRARGLPEVETGS